MLLNFSKTWLRGLLLVLMLEGVRERAWAEVEVLRETGARAGEGEMKAEVEGVSSAGGAAGTEIVGVCSLVDAGVFDSGCEVGGAGVSGTLSVVGISAGGWVDGSGGLAVLLGSAGGSVVSRTAPKLALDSSAVIEVARGLATAAGVMAAGTSLAEDEEDGEGEAYTYHEHAFLARRMNRQIVIGMTCSKGDIMLFKNTKPRRDCQMNHHDLIAIVQQVVRQRSGYRLCSLCFNQTCNGRFVSPECPRWFR